MAPEKQPAGSNKENGLIRGMALRLTAALLALATLSLAAAFFLEEVIQGNQSSAALVNVSGRQRMLSQRISLFAAQLSSAGIIPGSEATRRTRQRLNDAIELMETSHEGLLHGDETLNLPGAMSEAVHQLYFGPDRFVDRNVRLFLANAAALADGAEPFLKQSEHLELLLTASRKQLLEDLDAVVAQYQKEADENIAGLVVKHRLAQGLTLLVLLLFAVGVFIPMIDRLRQDMDRRRRLERALMDSEEWLFLTLDSAPDGIVTIDDSGLAVSFNRAAEKIFGYTEEEIVGRSAAQLLPPPFNTLGQLEVQRLIHAHKNEFIGQVREETGRRKDGGTFPLGLSVSQLQQRNHTFFIVIVRDATRRKEYENALRAAKESADAANQAKSAFLSSMSHELRTPMNAILGFGQLLANDPEEPLSANQSECVEQVIKGGQHLLALIDEILDLAKIESGRVSISLETIDPRSVFKECLETSQALALARGVQVATACPIDETVPYVYADHTRFIQVLLNLLSNAVKYNREGGTVTLSCEKRDEATLRILVRDDGPGIPYAQQRQMFEPFNRLGAENSKVEGTGIGLTICKQLVERMGGNIGFESVPENGSLFWFELPIDTEGALREEKALVEIPPPDPESPLLDAEGSLLCIEDNPANLALIQQLIARHTRLTLYTAENAELGMALADAHEPDVILMDINLPGLDGYKALNQLRASEAHRARPVIALSANAMPRDVERGLAAGFDRYLTKPIQIQTVLTALEETLQRVEN